MNRYAFFTVIFGFVFLLVMPACEEATDWQLQPGNNGQLVVEAIITDELKNQEIRLSQSYNDLNGLPIPITDATLVLNSLTERFEWQADSTDLGLYHSSTAFFAKKGVQYTLTIDWQDQTYTATAEMGRVFPFGPINFRNVIDRDSLEIIDVGPIYDPIEQAFYEIDIDWSHLIPSDSSHAKLFFYTFNTIDVSEIIRPSKERVLFPIGSIVHEKKYGLHDDFAAYLRTFVMETEWQGSAFDEASSSLPTNISNGGLGFFAVCPVLTETIIAK